MFHKTLTSPCGGREEMKCSKTGPSYNTWGCCLPQCIFPAPFMLKSHLLGCCVLNMTQNAPGARRCPLPGTAGTGALGSRSRFIEGQTLSESSEIASSSSRIGFTGPSPSSSLLREATDTAVRSTLRCEIKQCSGDLPLKENTGVLLISEGRFIPVHF